MTVNNTTLLGLALPVDGTEVGTWGDDVNNGITTFIEAAVSGTQTLNMAGGDVTLTTTNYSVGTPVLTGTSAQYAVLHCTGAIPTNRNVFLPNQSKIYLVINDCTGNFAVTFRGATGPTAGVSTAGGARVFIAWSGTDFILITNQNGTFIPATGVGIAGTTGADNASSGYWGEYQVQTSGSINIPTTNTPANIITYSIPAGDWDVIGSLTFNPSAGSFQRIVSVGTTSATLGGTGQITETTYTSTGQDTISTPTIRINVSTSTNVYLVGQANFSSGTISGAGQLRFRRIR